MKLEITMKTLRHYFCKSIFIALCLLMLGYSQFGYAGIEQYIRVNSYTKKQYICIENLTQTALQEVAAFLQKKDLDKNIDNFILADYSLSDENSFSKLIEALKTNITIKSLQLRVKSAGKFMPLLKELMDKNTTLTKLTLSRCGITDDDASNIAQILRKNSTLIELDLSKNNVADEGLIKIAQALEHNITLETINLSGNKFGKKGADEISRIILKNLTLKNLYVSECENLDEDSYITLLQALVNQRGLISIYLDDNKLTNKIANKLAEVLISNSNITVMELVCGGIDDSIAEIIAKGLEQNTALTAINLSYNHISNKGATSLAKVLAKNTVLTTIDLAWNKIDAIGMYELITAFACNTTLQKINVNFNSFNDKSINQLVETIIDRNVSLNTLTEYLNSFKMISDIPNLNNNNILKMIMDNTIYTHLSMKPDQEVQGVINEIKELQEVVKRSPMIIQGWQNK